MSKLRGYLSFLGSRERPSQSYTKCTNEYPKIYKEPNMDNIEDSSMLYLIKFSFHIQWQGWKLIFAKMHKHHWHGVRFPMQNFPYKLKFHGKEISRRMVHVNVCHSETVLLTSIFFVGGRDETSSLIECSLSSSCLVTAVPFFGLISDSSSVI